MERKVLENHKSYIQRKKLYLSYGFDVDKERKFIVDAAQPLFGDILEVGTGKGHFTLALAKEGYKFTSVDLSKEEQDIAKLNLRYYGFKDLVDWRIADARSLNFKDKSFDIIFSINLFHHLKNPFRVVDEFIRVLSFEGKIVIGDFSDSGFSVVEKIHASEGKVHKKAEITLEKVKEYFKDKKFKIEKYESKFQEVLVAYQPFI